jgi:hypothetical protein
MDMDGNPLYSYLDCFTTQTGEQYSVDNEAPISPFSHCVRYKANESIRTTALRRSPW